MVLFIAPQVATCFFLTLANFCNYTQDILLWSRHRGVNSLDVVKQIIPETWLYTADLQHAMWPIQRNQLPPPFFPGLSAAPSPQTWVLPPPPLPRNTFDLDSTRDGTAIVKLHIFSTPYDKQRRRRDLIRRQRWLDAVPDGYRHWVEIKFVIGTPVGDESDVTAMEKELQAEQTEHGDLFRLDMVENMNEGKSITWAREVGRSRSGERDGLWVFKVDDDTIVDVQRLLDVLTRLDPSIPTYLGDLIPHPTYKHSFMAGGFYGFSYGVLKTLAAAELSKEELAEKTWEDGRMGSFVNALPDRAINPAFSACPLPISSPDSFILFPITLLLHCMRAASLHPILALFRSIPTQPRWLLGPYISAPDCRSGLVRVSLRRFYGENFEPQVYGPGRSVAAHELKEDEEYDGWYERILQVRARRGREVWKVPDELRVDIEVHRSWKDYMAVAGLGMVIALISGLYSRRSGFRGTWRSRSRSCVRPA